MLTKIKVTVGKAHGVSFIEGGQAEALAEAIANWDPFINWTQSGPDLLLVVWRVNCKPALNQPLKRNH